MPAIFNNDPMEAYRAEAERYYNEQFLASTYGTKVRPDYVTEQNFWQALRRMANPDRPRPESARYYGKGRNDSYERVAEGVIQTAGVVAPVVAEAIGTLGLGIVGGIGASAALSGFQNFIGWEKALNQFQSVNDIRMASEDFMSKAFAGDPVRGRIDRRGAKGINDYIEKFSNYSSLYGYEKITTDELKAEIATMTEFKLLEGVKNAEDFEKKFVLLRDSMKKVTETLGTTFEETNEIFAQLKQVNVTGTRAESLIRNIKALGTQAGLTFEESLNAGQQAALMLSRTGISQEAAFAIGTSAAAGSRQIYQGDQLTGKELYKMGGEEGIRQFLAQSSAAGMNDELVRYAFAAAYDPDTGRIDEGRASEMLAITGRSGDLDSLIRLAQSRFRDTEDYMQFDAEFAGAYGRAIEADPRFGQFALLSSAIGKLKGSEAFKNGFATEEGRNQAIAEMLQVAMPGIGKTDVETMLLQLNNGSSGIIRQRMEDAATGEARLENMMPGSGFLGLGRLWRESALKEDYTKLKDDTQQAVRDYIFGLVEDFTENLTEWGTGVNRSYASGFSITIGSALNRMAQDAAGAQRITAAGIDLSQAARAQRTGMYYNLSNLSGGADDVMLAMIRNGEIPTMKPLQLTMAENLQQVAPRLTDEQIEYYARGRQISEEAIRKLQSGEMPLDEFAQTFNVNIVKNEAAQGYGGVIQNKIVNTVRNVFGGGASGIGVNEYLVNNADVAYSEINKTNSNILRLREVMGRDKAKIEDMSRDLYGFTMDVRGAIVNKMVTPDGRFKNENLRGDVYGQGRAMTNAIMETFDQMAQGSGFSEAELDTALKYLTESIGSDTDLPTGTTLETVLQAVSDRNARESDSQTQGKIKWDTYKDMASRVKEYNPEEFQKVVELVRTQMLQGSDKLDTAQGKAGAENIAAQLILGEEGNADRLARTIFGIRPRGPINFTAESGEVKNYRKAIKSDERFDNVFREAEAMNTLFDGGDFAKDFQDIVALQAMLGRGLFDDNEQKKRTMEVLLMREMEKLSGNAKVSEDLIENMASSRAETISDTALSNAYVSLTAKAKSVEEVIGPVEEGDEEYTAQMASGLRINQAAILEMGRVTQEELRRNRAYFNTITSMLQTMVRQLEDNPGGAPRSGGSIDPASSSAEIVQAGNSGAPMPYSGSWPTTSQVLGVAID